MGHSWAGKIQVLLFGDRSLMKTFYRGSSAAFVVYDVTQEKTFYNLDN